MAGLALAGKTVPQIHAEMAKASEIPIQGSPSRGPANAKITLVEFSDFQCPYCSVAIHQIDALLKAYPKLGKPLFPRSYYRQSLIGDEFTDISEALMSALFASDEPCPRSLLQATANEMIAERYMLDRLDDRQLDREYEHDEAEERLPVAQQHLDRGDERILARPEDEFGEPEDWQADAERQAHGGADDGEAQQETPAAQPHL